MKRLTTSEYIKLSFIKKIMYKLLCFFAAIPAVFANIGKVTGKGIAGFVVGVGKDIKLLFESLIKGSIFTKLSFIIMGFGNLCRGQIVRGVLFLMSEAVFIWYMISNGAYWLGLFDTLGDTPAHEEYSEIYDSYVRVPGDDSFKILLFGGFTIVFIILFIAAWRMNIRQSYENDGIIASGKKIKKFKDDLHDIVDSQFHKTLLALPITGITLFTLMPIVFMVLVAFTNYDGAHDGYSNLFTWVGWANFKELFGGSSLSYAFRKILGWTFVWAILATFTNYFLGIILAMMINKKGIKFKKMWRGIFVLTIAIPQFISLLYMSKLFAKNGMINGALIKLGILDVPFDFWASTAAARILVVVINIWIGIPYLMLIATGILMNIPEDLYESARIDGANAWQQFTKITMPYMLFITGPYLLTSFIGNMSNFNVIYLLAGGAEANPKLTTSGGTATNTDLLITWLFKITTGAESNYKLASVIGIMIFIVVATVSLIGFNSMNSNKNEEDFQ